MKDIISIKPRTSQQIARAGFNVYAAYTFMPLIPFKKFKNYKINPGGKHGKI